MENSRISRGALALALCLAALMALQLLHTLAFLHLLRLEDAAESLRSPYWWSVDRTVYNGVSSNVAYYATLAAAYRVFGFSLFLSKWLRLAFHLVSLLALAGLLRRWLGTRLALVPLLVIGTSPTWLFFNTNQAQLGFDLQCAPILLLALWRLPLGRDRRALGFAALYGAGFIFAALVYPVLLSYVPPLGVFLLWRWHREKPGDANTLAAIALAMAGGAIAVLAMFVSYAKEPMLLILDPDTQAGMLRGGGGGLSLDPLLFLQNSAVVLRDLFVGPSSYIFDEPNVEFSSWLSRAALAVVAAAAAWRVSRARRDPLLFWLLLSLAALFVVPQLVRLTPGLRRSTGVLFAYYGLVAWLWALACAPGERLPKGLRAALAAGVILQLAGNAATIRRNLEQGPGVAQYNTFFWFQSPGGPEEALAILEKVTREGKPLRCGEFNFCCCRYAEVFATIQGNRRWNDRPETPVLGWDPMRKENRILAIDLWASHEFPQ